MSPLLALLLLACSSGEGGDTSGDTGAEGAEGAEGAAGAAFCDGTPILTACPADALTFTGGRSVTSLDLSWRWSPECFTSVADPIYIEVPDDTATFTVTIDAGGEATAARFGRDGAAVGSFTAERLALVPHWGPAHTATMPESPEDGALGGCWAVFPQADSVAPDELPGRADLIGRRGDADSGRLPVVGIIVDEAPITAAQVDEVMAVVVAAFSAGGVAVEQSATEHLTFAPGAPLSPEEDRRALLQSWTDPEGTQAIPVFFVPEYNTSGVIGIAGGIPGAPLPGTASSGVTVAVEPLRDYATGEPEVDYMGQVVTHELGHQLGLWHTTESDGQHFDHLTDTPECDIGRDDDGDLRVSSWECDDAGADNVMFWQSRGYDQEVLTDDQLWMVAHAGAILP